MTVTVPNSAVSRAAPKSAAASLRSATAASVKSAGPPPPPKSGQKSGKKAKKKKSNRKIKEQSRNYEFVRRRRRESGEFCKAVLRFFFSNVGLILVAVFVAVFGAEMYISMEDEYEQRQKEAKIERAKKVEDAAEYLTGAFWWYAKDVDTYNYTQTEYENRTQIDLKDFVEYVLKAKAETKYDGTIDGWDQQWSTPNAILFTVSIMTIVGYGNISPKTVNGQLFTVIYSLIAIGSMFGMLKKIGDALADMLLYVYSRCCCRWFRSKRLESEIPSRTLRKKYKRRLIDEEIGVEAYMPTDRVSVPMIISVVVIFGYVALGSFMFQAWEEWDFVTATYFSFITLTTVGFGDYTPDNSMKNALKKGATFSDWVQMILCLIYLMFGLATLTTCLSLIQEAAAASARRALGMNKEKVAKDNIVYIPQRADIRVPGPEEPDYEAHRDESTCVIPMDDGPDEAPPTRPASAALSESASALPGAIDSDGGSDSGGEEEEGEDKEEDEAEDNDEEKESSSSSSDDDEDDDDDDDEEEEDGDE